MTDLHRIAAIDIGTNSVLLTIAERDPAGGIVTLVEEATITRLGEGLGTADTFCEAGMQRTLTVLRRYAEQCQTHQVHAVYAVGTAAFRKATNSKAFIQHVDGTCGIQIQIITGQLEAELAFTAAAHDFDEEILVLDIGGGSTEFIWPQGDVIQAHSFPIGSVILHEAYCHSDPISDDDFAALAQATLSTLETIKPVIQHHPERLVALAGTATTLAAMHLQLETYSHSQVHGTQLSGPDIDTILERLRAATLAERKTMTGLEPKRADVILSGALLLQQTMQTLGYDTVTISDRGVRWGILYNALAHTSLLH